jgi:hypothetical protein
VSGVQADERALWLRWVGANSVGESLGLGFTALVALAVADAGQTGRFLPLVAAAIALAAAGAVEGVAVGYAQWRVLRGPLKALRARSWTVATVIGALVAWPLGMVPSTLAGGLGDGGAPPFSDALQYLLAAVMGFVLGPVLGIPQWRVLRRFVPHAGRWVLANAAAWAAGMPVIFLAALQGRRSGSSRSRCWARARQPVQSSVRCTAFGWCGYCAHALVPSPSRWKRASPRTAPPARRLTVRCGQCSTRPCRRALAR